MAQVTVVKKARKSPGFCVRCRNKIEAGESYKWVAFRFGGARNIHTSCGSFKRGELTQNEKLSTLYNGQEELEQALAESFDSAEDIRTAISAMAEVAEEVAEMYRESASSIEEGFQHETEKSIEQNDNADSMDSYKQELESLEIPELGDWIDQQGYTHVHVLNSKGEVRASWASENMQDAIDDSDNGDETVVEADGPASWECCHVHGDFEQYEQAVEEWRSEVRGLVENVSCDL